MAKRAAVGLALVAGIGVAMFAAGGSGSTGPRPLPPPPKPTGKDEEIPRAVLERIAIAVASNDPEKLRAEAKRLRAEGYTAQAKSLEALANEIEAKEKVPVSGTNPPPPPPPPPAPGAKPPRDLVRGMKGEDVRTWQKQLIADGYGNIAADADFGQLTFAATVEWQWERELKDDGIVGKNTRAAIGTKPKRKRPAPSSPAPAKPPAPAPAAKPPKPPAVVQQPPKPEAKPKPKTPAPGTGTVPALLVGITLRRTPEEPFDQRVVLWQDQLKRAGVRPNVKSDGRFGANTEKQTRALQKAALLDETGIADPITIATGYGAPIPLLGPAPGAPPAAVSPAVPPLDINLLMWRSVLQKGNKGEDVRQWQQVLSRYGFEVKADGDFGALTHTATVAWQTAYARFADGRTLVPDGKVGKMTRERVAELERPKQIVAGELDAIPAGIFLPTFLPPSLAELEAPQASGVSELAHELVRNLEATAPGAEDRELVQRFQSLHGLNATGSYGPATAEALIALGIVPPKPRWWPSKKLFRAQYRYRVALREQAHRDPSRADEWLSASAAF